MLRFPQQTQTFNFTCSLGVRRWGEITLWLPHSRSSLHHYAPKTILSLWVRPGFPTCADPHNH